MLDDKKKLSKLYPNARHSYTALSKYILTNVVKPIFVKKRGGENKSYKKSIYVNKYNRNFVKNNNKYMYLSKFVKLLEKKKNKNVKI